MKPQVYRRRRLVALLSAVAAAAVVGIVVLAVSGTNSRSPRYVPPGGGTTAPRTPGGQLSVAGQASWHPAPAAVRALARLSLAAQVAQLFVVPVTGRAPGGAAALSGGGWGGVILARGNYTSPAQLAKLTAAVRGALRGAGPIEPLIAAGQEGGPATAFPHLPPQGEDALGTAGHPAAAGTQATLAAARLRTLGVSMTLAPLADVDIPTGALSGRLFGTDPATVARFTRQAVDGYARGGLIDAVSHFPGEGSASADPDQQPATVGGTLASLRSADLVPFAAVADRAPVIQMSNAAYAAYDGVTPASLLPQAVALLRSQLHFAGVVMSGDLDATLPPTGGNPGAAALSAVKAGDDLLLLVGPPSEQQAAYSGLLTAVRHLSSVRALVHQAALRDLTLKHRYGLLAG